MDFKKMTLMSIFGERCIDFDLLYEVEHDVFIAILRAYRESDWEKVSYILDTEF